MSESRKCLTFIWKIKNFNLCFGVSGIHSPVFFAHVLDGTKWSLGLFIDSKFQGCIACHIRRENDDSHIGLFQLDYELSILDGNGSVLYSKMFLKKLYNTFNTNWKTALLVKKEEVFLQKKNLFMPDGALTIRCRMWNSETSILQSESCFAETTMKTQRKTFVGTIKKFNCLELREVYSIFLISKKENFLYSMELCVEADDKFKIQVLVRNKFFRPYIYKIFILDIFGNKVKYGHGECHDIKHFHFPLALSKEHLMENKSYYFPKNILTIECEIIFTTGKTKEKKVKLEYGFDFQDIQGCTSKPMKTNLSSEEYLSKSFTTLTDGFSSLLKDGVLCDTELKTATKTFPAHKAVLAARSPTLKSMFENDMTKKANKCIIIDELDADTVRLMLLFMYTDALDLKYESAKNLHFAAYKYSIAPLMHKCSNFLKQYILLNNCCEMLFQADKQKDDDLKSAVKDYITKNSKTVFSSDEWKHLEKNHPLLTIEVLRGICMEK